MTLSQPCFALPSTIPHRPTPSSLPVCRRHFQTHPPTRCATTLPSTYTELRTQAVSAVQSALSQGMPLLEVQFPAVSNMATAALNELLDANREFVREFLLSFTPRHPRGAVIAVFPDAGEARLAAKVYGKVPFAVGAIPRDGKTPSYVSGEDGMVTVVNPGFNVDEWMNMELLAGDKPVVAVNADLDKVRGGYYPRLFYPGLFKVKTRFLSRFEAAYYVKQFSNGGTLMRCFPEPWTLFYKSAEGGETRVVWTGEERPDFVEVERILAAKRVEDMSRR